MTTVASKSYAPRERGFGIGHRVTSGCRLGLLGAIVLANAGCTYTVVRFTSPPGATLKYHGKQYTFPAEVKLLRPGGAGDIDRSQVEMTFPKHGLAAEGNIQVYGFHEQDVDRYSENTCAIGDEQLENLNNGYALVVVGTSASGQPQYRIALGKKK